MSKLVAATLIVSGLATRYSPDLMDQVVANRVRWGQLEPGTDPARCVALLDCSLGNEVWLEMPGGRIAGPFVVADCAQENHRTGLIASGWAVDLSYELAMELGVMDRPLAGVKVWDGDPRWQRLRRAYGPQ